MGNVCRRVFRGAVIVLTVDHFVDPFLVELLRGFGGDFERAVGLHSSCLSKASGNGRAIAAAVADENNIGWNEGSVDFLLLST